MTNEHLKKHLQEQLAKGVRMDGRELLQFRDLEIEYGVSSTAHGSARVTAGNNVIVAGVKIEPNRPYPDRPDEGGLMVSAEMLALSHRKFEGGRPGIDAIEFARVVDRSIRESETIDAKKLLIEEGEKAWFVGVDLAPIAYDGNPIDLGVIAAMAALQDARMPVMDKDGNVDLETLSDEKLPLRHQPVSVTVFKYGDALLVDPTENEELYYDARLSVGTLEDGRPCSMQKGGEGPLTVEVIEQMIKIAREKGDEIRGVMNK